LRVIEAHRAAYGALDQAIRRESAAEDAYRGILGFREHMERPLEDYASPKQLKQIRGAAKVITRIAYLEKNWATANAQDKAARQSSGLLRCRA
jgi:hypothetical protein